MSFFRKLKDRLLKSSSKIDEGLEAILRTNRLVSGTPFLESLCWSVGQFTQGLHIDDISAILIEREAG